MAKSLLRYPGGKTRAIKILEKYIPKEVEEICSPFFGGGSFEFHLNKKGIKVNGYDFFKPLVDFWQVALKRPEILAEEIKKYYPLEKDKFYEMQKKQEGLSKLETAAIFYVLNRSSFSGSTLSGGMSPKHPRFTEKSIKNVLDFNAKDIYVEYEHFRNSIPLHSNNFLYLDPPYLINNFIYGEKGNKHKGFEHEELREILIGRNGWIMSYNDCDEILKMYDKFKIIRPEWNYGMSKDKKSKEILIINF